MIHLHSLRLQNTFLFKDQTFFFNRKGISLIHGLNLNSSKRNSNAVGKSSFYQALPELIIGTPMIGSRLDRMRQGKVTLKLTKDEGDEKIRYVIVQDLKGSEKLRVYRNGQDMAHHTVQLARAFIKEQLFNTSDEELQTLVYLDSRVSHPLVMGDTGARRKFFTSFFKLDSVDGMRKLVSAQISELRSQKLLFNELRTQYNDKRGSLFDDDTIEAKRYKLQKAERLSKKYVQQLNEINKARSAAEMLQNPLYRRLLNLCDNDLSNFEALFAFTRNAYETAKLRIRIARKWTEAQQQLKEYKRQVQRVIDKTNELWGDDDPPDAALVKKEAQRYEKVQDEADEYRALVSKATIKLNEYQQSTERAVERATQLQQELTDLKTSPKCPTCGQPVKANDQHIKEMVANLKANITQNNEMLERFQAKAKECKRKLRNCTYNVEAYDKELQQLQRYRKAANILEQMPEKPDTFDGERLNEEDETSKYEKLSKRMSFLESCQSLIDSFRKASNLSEEELQLAQSDIEEINAKIAKAHSIISTITFDLESQDTLRSEIKELRTRLKKMKELIDEEEALSLLETAFSQKGVKALMIRSICSRLEQTINKYAKLVFPEDYRFEFNLDTQFSILVHRNYGKQVSTSDVRKLSGAEYKLFCLLLMLGLMTFMPASKRWNTVILDEPSANMSPELQQSFSKFLPILNKQIPHIIVITPKTQEVYEGSKIYTVVKKGGKSTIVEGSGDTDA
jgi:DNA repair exonuclease SbcCD ATPase subunit